MKITGLIWLDAVVDKLEHKHHVMTDEVKGVLEARPKFRFVEKGHRRRENVYAALGQTAAGRHLIVFFIRKRDGRALIISAREMTVNERRRYERK